MVVFRSPLKLPPPSMETLSTACAENEVNAQKQPRNINDERVMLVDPQSDDGFVNTVMVFQKNLYQVQWHGNILTTNPHENFLGFVEKPTLKS